MDATKAKCGFHTFVSNGKISLLVWTFGGCVSMSADLTEIEARRLAQELLDVADKMPRIATAEDFGMKELA